MGKIISVITFVLGVVFAQIAEPQIQDLWDRSYDNWCGGTIALKEGKVALAKALKAHRSDLAKEAMVALEKSARCQMGEAHFLLGLIHCNGIGVEKNIAKGRQAFRSAIKREPQWAMEILANPKLCRTEY